MKNLIKFFAMSLGVLSLGLGVFFEAKSAEEPVPIPWCRYTSIDSDYCSIGNTQITHCVNSTAGGSCGIAAVETPKAQS